MCAFPPGKGYVLWTQGHARTGEAEISDRLSGATPPESEILFGNAESVGQPAANTSKLEAACSGLLGASTEAEAGNRGGRNGPASEASRNCPSTQVARRQRL